MDEIISKLKTPEECLWFSEICTDLAQVAKRRAIKLRAINFGNKSEVETALWEAILA